MRTLEERHDWKNTVLYAGSAVSVDEAILVFEIRIPPWIVRGGDRVGSEFWW